MHTDKQVVGLEVVLASSWLVEPDMEETRAQPGDPGFDPSRFYGVALASDGRVVVHVRHATDDEPTALYDFESVDDIPAEVLPSRLRRLAVMEAALLVEDDTLSLYGS